MKNFKIQIIDHIESANNPDYSDECIEFLGQFQEASIRYLYHLHEEAVRRNKDKFITGINSIQVNKKSDTEYDLCTMFFVLNSDGVVEKTYILHELPEK